MLEAGRVGGVAGDGDVDAFVVHDGHALADIVSAVAADVGALALGVADLADDVQLAGVVVELGLDIGEAVDAGDDLGGVLAEAVQDDAQGLFAGLVGVLDDADGAFSGGEGLVAGEEGRSTSISSDRSIAPRLPWPRPTLRSSATEPSMQKDCRPTPMAWQLRQRS